MILKKKNVVDGLLCILYCVYCVIMNVIICLGAKQIHLLLRTKGPLMHNLTESHLVQKTYM